MKNNCVIVILNRTEPFQICQSSEYMIFIKKIKLYYFLYMTFKDIKHDDDDNNDNDNVIYILSLPMLSYNL